MAYFPLSNFDSSNWELLKERLENTNFKSIKDFTDLVSDLGNVEKHFESINFLLKNNTETELVSLFNQVIKYSLKLEVLIPDGKIIRLTNKCPNVEFNRLQILCILCHMFICSTQKTKYNMYWVNFENWLTDGRTCANTYLQTLIEYFKQSFSMINDPEYNEFMNEAIQFKRKKIDLNQFNQALNDDSIKLSKVNLKSSGFLGDESNVEIDFANMDIGFGITGTQEEILFGSSPEMCIAMLFCDTMADDEAIVIKGARKVAIYNGYGLNLSFKELLPFDLKIWKDRIVIAIDAIDFSCEIDSFKKQIEKKSLERELKKAFVGFSSVNNSIIETGHWGCGAFNGNKYLKALIQIISVSLTSNELNFYCFNENEFFTEFFKFLTDINEKNVTCKKLWSLITTLEANEPEILNWLLRQI